jgi:schlafen family protein
VNHIEMDEALDLQERVRLAVRIGESLYREFKSASHGRPGQKGSRPLKEVLADVAETLVAFANADGGELLVGVHDDSRCGYNPHLRLSPAFARHADSDAVIGQQVGVTGAGILDSPIGVMDQPRLDDASGQSPVEGAESQFVFQRSVQRPADDAA